MSSLLPYFKWYPADAETNSEYCAMTYAERGLYHHCLNVSWLNDGLPADLDELARVLRINRAQLDELWPRVSKCFCEVEGKLLNLRQETERSEAIKKSSKATDAAKLRYERTADALRTQSEGTPKAVPRAYESGSISESVSDSSSEIKKTTLREVPKTVAVAKSTGPPGFDFMTWMEERDRKHPIPGKPQLAIQYAQDKIFKQFTPEQFNAAHDAWCEYWKGQDGGIPSLAVFINEAWWRKLPPKRAGPKPKDSWEGVERRIQENIERTGKPW